MLATDFTMQLADAELLVELDDDGLFVVTEEASKGRGEGFALWKQEFSLAVMKYGKGAGKIDGWIWRTFLGPCGLRDDFLRFPYEHC